MYRYMCIDDPFTHIDFIFNPLLFTIKNYFEINRACSSVFIL